MNQWGFFISQFGGFVFGSDIDYLMLHAKTRPSRKGQKRRSQDEKFRANFEQYGLASRYRNDRIIEEYRFLLHRPALGQSQGPAKSFLGSSTGWWADTTYSYCANRQERNCKRNY